MLEQIHMTHLLMLVMENTFNMTINKVNGYKLIIRAMALIHRMLGHKELTTVLTFMSYLMIGKLMIRISLMILIMKTIFIRTMRMDIIKALIIRVIIRTMILIMTAVIMVMIPITAMTLIMIAVIKVMVLIMEMRNIQVMTRFSHGSKILKEANVEIRSMALS